MANVPYDDNSGAALTRGEVIAVGCGFGWLFFAGIVFLIWPPVRVVGAGFDSLSFLLMILVVLIPLLMIWVAISVSRACRTMQTEAVWARVALDGVRQSIHADKTQKTVAEPDVEKKLDAIVQATKNTETALTSFASRREVSRLIVPKAAPNPATASQRTLPLGTSAEELDPPLERPDLIRSLNFPDNENDTEGFAALRRALRDRGARKLVQAAQDVLTLLSQDGIYMDDLRPGAPDADVWRRFAKGERGPSIDTLGGVRDRSSLALTTGRMREDTIFRDTVHHFLRKFDHMLVTFEEHANDTDMIALADTRTARAFMLLGRATGTFD